MPTVPSGLRRQSLTRSFGQKLRWGPGEENFFKKMFFDLSPIFIFTLVFKPCVTFLLIYVAIFHKMLPLFSFEPTVDRSATATKSDFASKKWVYSAVKHNFRQFSKLTSYKFNFFILFSLKNHSKRLYY